MMADEDDETLANFMEEIGDPLVQLNEEDDWRKVSGPPLVCS